MKNIRNIFIILVLAFGLIQAGEITKKGTTAAPFLKIGVGARAAAMGESYVAEVNDASALFWNPAGLARLKENEVMFVRTDWVVGITYDFAGLVAPLGELGTFGLFYSGLNVGDMEVRTEQKPEGTGEIFGATSLALGLSYARNMTGRFAFGISGKYIHEQIWHETSSTFAIDVGITYLTSVENLRLGMAITNYGGKMQLDGKDLLVFHDVDPNLDGNNENVIAKLNTEKYDIPLGFRVGLAYDPVKSDFHRVTMSVDGVTPNDYNEYLNFGGEYAFREMVFLRAGYKGIGLKDQEGGFSAGGGIAYKMQNGVGLKIDYAYVDYVLLDKVQRFSLSLLF
jgi:long-subunit fatty acid transport protein